jgi:hypothetical protein
MVVGDALFVAAGVGFLVCCGVGVGGDTGVGDEVGVGFNICVGVCVGASVVGSSAVRG